MNKFKIGDYVYKTKGYKYVGTVVSVFKTTANQTILVVEMEGNGMLHIFSESNLDFVSNLYESDSIGDIKSDNKTEGEKNKIDVDFAVQKTRENYRRDILLNLGFSKVEMKRNNNCFEIHLGDRVISLNILYIYYISDKDFEEILSLIQRQIQTYNTEKLEEPFNGILKIRKFGL